MEVGRTFGCPFGGEVAQVGWSQVFRDPVEEDAATMRPFGGPEGQRQFIFGYSSTGSRSKNTWFPEASTGRETCPFIYVIYVVTQGGKHSITQLPLRLSDRTKVRSNENSFRSLARFTRSGPARGRERFSAQPDGMKGGRSPQVGALPPQVVHFVDIVDCLTFPDSLSSNALRRRRGVLPTGSVARGPPPAWLGGLAARPAAIVTGSLRPPGEWVAGR